MVFVVETEDAVQQIQIIEKRRNSSTWINKNKYKRIESEGYSISSKSGFKRQVKCH